jgi:hypothetical protein
MPILTRWVKNGSVCDLSSLPFQPHKRTSLGLRARSENPAQKATWKAGPLSHNSGMPAFRKPGEHSLVMSQFELFVRGE